MSMMFDNNDQMYDFVDSEFYLRAELYYSQPPQHNFMRACNSAEVMKEEVSKGANRFRCVQTKVFQINGALQGMSTFVPISFDREYTSQCMFTLHSSVIDFKFFAPQSTNIVLSSSNSIVDENIIIEDETEVQTFTENGILVERK